MPARLGYDPRKSVLASNLDGGINAGMFCQLAFVLAFFSFWNFGVFMAPWCAANLWTRTLTEDDCEGSIMASGASMQQELSGSAEYANFPSQQAQSPMAPAVPPAYGDVAHPYFIRKTSIPGYTKNPNDDLTFSSSMRNLGAQTLPPMFVQPFEQSHASDHYVIAAAAPVKENVEDRIAKLAALRDQGVLTPERFELALAKLLSEV